MSVTTDEFMNFFGGLEKGKLLAWKALQWAVNRNDDKKKVDVHVRDILRVMWPAALDEDVEQMFRIFVAVKHIDNAVKEPPKVIGAQARSELIENFKYMDTKHVGRIPFVELAAFGLVDDDTMTSLIQEFDTNGDGMISQEEFVEMMCPDGMRASTEARSCRDKNGRKLIYVDTTEMNLPIGGYTGWAYDDG